VFDHVTDLNKVSKGERKRLGGERYDFGGGVYEGGTDYSGKLKVAARGR